MDGGRRFLSKPCKQRKEPTPVSTRVSPVERVRADIDDLFASDRDLGEVLEEVARLGVRLLMQTAIEAEVTEFLGRERYARGERAREGSRNGHCPTTIKTTTGPVTIDRPKLRGSDETLASRLLSVGVCRTNALGAWSSPASCGAWRCATWRPPWPRPWAPRQRCRSRR